MTTRFNHSLKLPLAIAAAGMAAALAGCGGSGSLGQGSDLIRSVDAIPNGGTATIDINSGTVQGNQTFFSTSPYLYINPGSSDFSFTLSSNPATTYPTITSSLVGDAHYTAILTGLTNVPSSSDTRYPQVFVLLDDQTPPPSGYERVRLVNTAPDAGTLDLIINGNVVNGNVPYASGAIYQNVPAGASTVILRQTGTANIVAGPTQINIASGGAMSIFAAEPSVGPPPTYAIQTTTDF